MCNFSTLKSDTLRLRNCYSTPDLILRYAISMVATYIIQTLAQIESTQGIMLAGTIGYHTENTGYHVDWYHWVPHYKHKVSCWLVPVCTTLQTQGIILTEYHWVPHYKHKVSCWLVPLCTTLQTQGIILTGYHWVPHYKHKVSCWLVPLVTTLQTQGIMLAEYHSTTQGIMLAGTTWYHSTNTGLEGGFWWFQFKTHSSM